ncbi:DUF3566 domain-containing protein [Carbonactinospora thermoautotrophica]|uniref:DUF3566 domain-containing protein n=1 Tax=Carbonactinospora thermoautotrophica TaxID=1469144 RepID=UPI000835FF94|nr:DUF3566 domain-containing protein [Carbonactinospora thermoautotrophica]
MSKGNPSPDGAGARGQETSTEVMPVLRAGAAPARPGAPFGVDTAASGEASSNDTADLEGSEQAAGSPSQGPTGAGGTMPTAAIRRRIRGRRLAQPAEAPPTRRARLRLAKVDPWSVMKISFVLSIALGVVLLIATAVLWAVLDVLGVISAVSEVVGQITGSDTQAGFNLQNFLSLPRVLAFTVLVAIIDVILITALATIGAYLYNMAADFVGGLELTLAEDE